MAAGRPSVLTDKQWAEARAMRLAGRTYREIGAHFNVSHTTIVEGIASQVKTITDVANQYVQAETALNGLPPYIQVDTRSAIDRLRVMQYHLAAAAELGAQTAHRLSAIANSQVDFIDERAPQDSMETLSTVAALIKTANMASEPARDLIKAAKGALDDSSKDGANETRIVVINSPDA